MIEEAALDLIASEGLEALTMARLAEEVELTPGALYRYFEGKDALIVALQARALGQIESLLEARRAAIDWPRDPGLRALAELTWIARFYRRLADEEARIFALVSATIGDPRKLVADEHARTLAAPVSSLLGGVAERFAAAAAEGALAPGDAASRAVVFWSAVHGVTSVAKLDRIAPGIFAPIARVDELTRALLLGWGAEERALTTSRTHLEETDA